MRLGLGLGVTIASVGGGTLAISPSTVSKAPGGTQTFVGSGGAGGYTYSLATNNSGGSVNSTTGLYTAGSTGSVSDVVRVTDSLSATADATVTVTAAIAISPSSATKAPGASQTFTATGGAGSNVFSIFTNNSGGTINSSSGAYVAGTTGSVSDTVRVTDANSKTSSATVTVTAGVSLSPSAPTVVAYGTTTFTASGGSGTGFVYSISTNNSGGTINSSTGVYVAGTIGNVTDTVRATDSLGNIGSTNVAVWSPANLGATLLIWYDSEHTTNSSGKVDTMVDRSGNANTGINAGGGLRPTYNATDATFNNFPSIQNADNTRTETTSALTYGAHTVYWVGTATDANSYMYVHGSDSGTDAEYCYPSTGNTTNVKRSGTVSSYNLTSNWGVNSTARTIGIRFDGTHAGHTMKINGTTQALTGVSSGDPGTGTVAGTFACYAVPAGSGTAGKWVDFIVCDSALSAGNVTNLEAYLRAKYAHY